MQIPGKFVWYEHVSQDPKRAQAFWGEVLGWRTRPFEVGGDSYDMIYVGEEMIGGYDKGSAGHFIAYVSVPSVDDAVATAVAKGGKVITPAQDLPTVGRMARIADPQGAHISLFTSEGGDMADRVPTNGEWLWCELHTPDPKAALAFYQAVIGWEHKSMDMGPAAGTYHVIGKGGVDRGGVTHHLAPGEPPHWLPYVHVDDTDATVARAERLGGKVPMPCENIPGVGRFGILQDPTGAVLAVMKPSPRQ
jgi:hypothetical protein